MNAARTSWTKCFNLVLDAVYPTRCGLCGELGPLSICEACSSNFEENDEAVQRGEGLDFTCRLYRYEGRAAQAVTRLKYSRVTSISREMSRRVADFGQSLGLFDDSAVIPVPIHWSRRAQRGFNQAELLCEAMPLGIVQRDWLKRVRATKPQAGLSLEARQKNLSGAFMASPMVSGRSILLVDDVVTSGETAAACAKALYGAGATEVGILAFAGNLD